MRTSSPEGTAEIARLLPLKRETDTNKMLNTEYYAFVSAVSKLASRTRTQRPSGSLRKIVSV
jgi:hypothetical protein